MKTCDKCGREARVRPLHYESSEAPGSNFKLGDYGPGCFYAAAATLRRQGHRPRDGRTGREVFTRDRT